MEIWGCLGGVGVVVILGWEGGVGLKLFYGVMERFELIGGIGYGVRGLEWGYVLVDFVDIVEFVIVGVVFGEYMGIFVLEVV